MSEFRFEWDAGKAARNLRKHGISFDEAKTVFHDEHVFRTFDLLHSEDEDREILIGFSKRARVLVATERYEAIRIISARRATQAEARRYAEQDFGPLR